jgi:hypothetical protein
MSWIFILKFSDHLFALDCEREAGYEGWKGRFNTGCFDSLNPSNPAYHDLTVNNWANRQWNWMLCNEP